MEDHLSDAPTVGKVALKWGVITGVVFILYSVIINLTGNFGNQSLGYLSYLILIGGIIMAHREFKSEGNGFMSYKQGLGMGTLVSLYSGLLSAVFTFIYMSFVDTSLTGQLIDMQRTQMEEQGMSDAQIEQSMNFMESFMSPVFISVMSIVFVVFFGFILSLIITAFTKNTDPETQM